MKLKKLNQTGVAVLEIILIIFVIGAVAGIGYYVYQAKIKTNKTLDSTAQGAGDAQKSEKKKEAEKPTSKEEDSWMLYTSPNKKYSLRLPDGWQLICLIGKDNIYGRGTDKIVYKKGVAATVQNVEGGWDGPSRFALYVPDDPSQITKDGTEQSTFKTDSGLTVHKYFYEETKDPEAIGYSKGDKVYSYYFEAAGKNIQVQHVISTGATDQSAYVERAVKTLKVN